MNVRLKDACPHCGEKGLPSSERGQAARRRCGLCFREEARPCDRVLYLACRCEILWDHDERRARHRLGGWWSVEPFFSRAEAEEYVSSQQAREQNSWEARLEWRPVEVQGRWGVYAFTSGGNVFLFIDEKLVDVTALGRV